MLPDICPKCGTATDFGFGLAGGGYGPYVYCLAESCDFFAKEQERDPDADAPPRSQDREAGE
jgi:hypothetical protein